MAGAVAAAMTVMVVVVVVAAVAEVAVVAVAEASVVVLGGYSSSDGLLSGCHLVSLSQSGSGEKSLNRSRFLRGSSDEASLPKIYFISGSRKSRSQIVIGMDLN